MLLQVRTGKKASTTRLETVSTYLSYMFSALIRPCVDYSNGDPSELHSFIAIYRKLIHDSSLGIE
jgi:hypothetical protein